MRCNQAGLDLIRECEGLELEAYPDPGSPLFILCKKNHVSPYNGQYKELVGWERVDGSPWTIGYGQTGDDVYPGLVITPDDAVSLLSDDLTAFEIGVSRIVKVDLTENQFSALVVFAYNVGVGALESSTLLKLLNKYDYAGAANQLIRWNKSGGKVLPGLTKRRNAERMLFLS